MSHTKILKMRFSLLIGDVAVRGSPCSYFLENSKNVLVFTKSSNKFDAFLNFLGFLKFVKIS